ncbi:MAG: DUF362 domain-containing protein [Lachnospiraceae bacterium]|nr:DUF362 domain-containing protein [Lachnospiraceae bacterium]
MEMNFDKEAEKKSGWLTVPERLKETVAVTACDHYGAEEVKAAVERLVDLLGGLDWVREGMTVAVKVNLVAPMEPQTAGTTHPSVVAELCRLLRQRGARVLVGDSPGGLFNESFVRSAYRKCGYEETDLFGAELNSDYSVSHGRFDQAVSIRTFTYTGWLDQADAIINVCKLKTHAMMAMTCSVKNLFGTIPGTTKPEYHMRFPDSAAFANLMVDLNEYFTPIWNIVDAVVGMEGNGPTSGKPKQAGLLLGSANPYALDAVCADMLGLGREDVPTIQEAYRRGLGPDTAAQVELQGDTRLVRKLGFELVSKRMSTTFGREGWLGALISKAGRWALRTRPNVCKKDCVGCRKCEQICPARAISMVEKKPVIDREKCIRCFCCQEFCPKGAMKVEYTWIGRLISRLNHTGTSHRK